ncbi:protein kinase domain-containing protein [Novipirellula artificiosorum]|uniref:non-specific serine/threonine protein kinase n=1 Tax=Novipirellula artificiosorum TaxID=2528016 RepID=A0A5C6DM40_9BACT|nr:protein kinase [Novipirellula artificiosorum]TWU35929.1 Serine/threonine-protein kinase PknB [Novipirellula artificiosorum]
MTSESSEPNELSPQASSREDGDVSSAKLIGCRLGDYQILRKLGRGGMADVYAARHLTLGRDVAMKILRSDYARDGDYVARFRREAKAAAKLNHPNIVQVYEVGSVDSFHYIAQELIHGDNLRHILSRSGSLSTDEAVEVLVAVGSALEVAAEAGITHRDIKPENIMRSSRGIVKVADFGLARLGPDVDASRADLTQAGLTLGTPRYMSPEQIQGHTVDSRSDLYSLGITMYHLLAGRPPFEAEDPLALAVMHLHETPIPLDRARGTEDLPEWLVAIVSKLIRKRPEDRFQSPSELLASIRSRAIDAGYSAAETIGTAAATIRLQRVADQSRLRQRSPGWRRVAIFLIPLGCIVATAAFFLSHPAKSVTRVLRPDQVPQAKTVEEQYLIAATRNDEAGWRAVSDYFPASENNSLNTNYHAKSLLQMARLMAAELQWQQADRVLEDLLRNPRIDRLYQALALAQRCNVLEQLGETRRLTESQTQLQTIYRELDATNPSALAVFDRVVSEKERLQLGLTIADRGDT